MKPTKVATIVSLALMALLTTATRRSQAAEVGAVAPSFAGSDEQGRRVSLDDYRGAKHIVLVFYIGYG